MKNSIYSKIKFLVKFILFDYFNIYFYLILLIYYLGSPNKYKHIVDKSPEIEPEIFFKIIVSE